MPETTSLKTLKKVVNGVINGHSQAEIGESIGLTQSGVSRMLKRPSTRILLDKAYTDLVSLAPAAVSAYKDEIEAKPETLGERELRIKVAGKIMDSVGLSPVRDLSNNPFFAQIIQVNNVSLSPIVGEVLTRISGTQPATVPDTDTEPDWTDAELADDA